MDDYAIRSADLGSPSASLFVVGASYPGAAWTGALEQGNCVRIFTGAPLPAVPTGSFLRSRQNAKRTSRSLANVQEQHPGCDLGEWIFVGATNCSSEGDCLTPGRGLPRQVQMEPRYCRYRRRLGWRAGFRPAHGRAARARAIIFENRDPARKVCMAGPDRRQICARPSRKSNIGGGYCAPASGAASGSDARPWPMPMRWFGSTRTLLRSGRAKSCSCFVCRTV